MLLTVDSDRSSYIESWTRALVEDQPTILIRVARSTDAASIAAVYNEYVGQGTATLEEEPWSGAKVVSWLADAGERQQMVVAELDGQVVGWGQIKSYSDRGGYRGTCEIAEYLSSAATGRGIGKRLMESLLSFTESAGYRHIVAKIIADNTASIGFHERHGFTIVGTQNGIGECKGRLIDVTIMQRVVAR